MKKFEKGKKYIFDFNAYERIHKAFSFRKISDKIKDLNGASVTVINECTGRVAHDCMTIRPEFCKEV